ncbi:MAG: DUF3179 domain-containing protein [Bacteroidota bacterium]
MSKKYEGFYLVIILMLFALGVMTCTNGRLAGEWTVPVNQIAEGEGSGDIPTINNPQFTLAKEVNFLEDSSIVLGLSINGIIRAYPLEIMEWHEVVNDQFDTIPVAITYSTLSGSSVALDRRIDNKILDFQVTGLLYNSNTILNEFTTFSDWSQMLRQGVRGDFSFRVLKEYSIFEMRWEKWKKLFPSSEVLNRNTGFNRPYGVYPYGDYQTEATQIFFNLPLDIDSLNAVYPSKEKVLGVKIGGVVKGYPLDQFLEKEFTVIADEVNGQPIIVVGSTKHQFMVAYSALSNAGEVLTFVVENQDDGVFLVDHKGQSWTIFGELVEKPDTQLTSLTSNIAYYFTWATFYPDFDIFH